MSAFSSAELTAMQAAQEAHMMDTCVIRRYVDGQGDDYGPDGPPSYPEDAPIACGFKPASVREIMDGTQVAMKTAEIRLPIDTEIDAKDHIRITERFGETLLTNEVYRIVGEPKRGPSGLVLQVETVSEEKVLER